MKSTHALIIISIAILSGTIAPYQLHAQPRWQWVVPASGQTFDEGYDIGVGPDGDVHAVGQFSDSLHVGSDTLIGVGNYDAFSLRLSSTGKVKDYDAYGGVVEDAVKTIAVDNKGNYYIAGTFEDMAIVGGQTIESIEPFTIDMFVAKFDKSSVIQWVKVFGSPDFDEPPPFLAVDSLGNVYLAGGFGKTATFGTKTLTSTGSNDMFVAKISALGDVTWAKRAGSTHSDFATDVAVSPNGDRVYVVGNFTGSVNFGGTSALESYADDQDMVVWALSADGAYQWAKRIGYQGKDNGINCSADNTGRLLVTGGMMQTTTFGTSDSLKANGELAPDIFVARFTKSGAIDLLNRFGGIFKDVGHGVVADSRGGIYVTGEFDTTTTIGTTVLTSSGGMDIVVMRLWPNGQAEWARSSGGEYDDVGNAIALGVDGTPYVCGTFDTEAWFGSTLVKGERFSDAFVGALECGPNTELNPKDAEFTLCEGSDKIVAAQLGYDVYQWFVDNEPVNVGRKTELNLKNLNEGIHYAYVRIVDAYGCVGFSDTVKITVTPGLPEPVITKTGNVLGCSVAEVTYQWYYEGNPIQGGTNQTQELIGQGLYKVLISDDKGCTRFSANFIEGTTGVAGDDVVNALIVAPNPFADFIQVQGGAGATASVVDMLGNIVMTATLTSNIEHLSLNVVTGTYVLLIRNGSEQHSVLITKQ